MFDLGYSELLLIAVVALVVIGPKDLPKALRVVGQWMGKGRAMARHMRSGFDEMMRQAEMEEMEKQWKQHNADIMATSPAADTPMSARENFTHEDTARNGEARDAEHAQDVVPEDPMVAAEPSATRAPPESRTA